MPDFIDMLLRGGSPTTTQFLNPLNGLPPGRTPGFNPNAPLPGVSTPVKPQSGFNKLLSNPMLLNILAQSGSSLTPGPSPLGVIGRAGLATQQQNQQTQQSELERRLIESQIGVNTAKASQPGDIGKPQTDLAKLNDDLRFGRISQKDYDVRRNQILKQDINNNFDRTSALRSEFRKDTDSIQTSLQSLTAARSLASADNPTAELAAFISTIKSIDNSTVREGELEAFRNIQALATKLDELKQKAGEGGFSPTLLKDIDNTITALEKPLSELLDKRKDFYRTEAGRFDVNPDSVAGLPFSQVGPSTRQSDGGALDSKPPNVPPMTPQAKQSGVTQEEWAVMPPEDRALFQ